MANVFDLSGQPWQPPQTLPALQPAEPEPEPGLPSCADDDPACVKRLFARHRELDDQDCELTWGIDELARLRSLVTGPLGDALGEALESLKIGRVNVHYWVAREMVPRPPRERRTGATRATVQP